MKFALYCETEYRRPSGARTEAIFPKPAFKQRSTDFQVRGLSVVSIMGLEAAFFLFEVDQNCQS